MLEVQELEVRYGDLAAVRSVSFALEAGEIGGLLGASGCGKTTVLRTIAGFLRPAAGRVIVDGETLSDVTGAVAPEHRNVGIVPQDLALFPHLSVAGNIAFGLRSWAPADRSDRIRSLLALIGLDAQGTAFPHELSGGQRQRVAIARALAPRPRLLLLDEPFSSLDPALRIALPRELRQLFLDEDVTALLVTHDQHEAFAMCDRVGVLAGGELAQWDRAYALYHEPANRVVADFVGEGVMLPGRVSGEITVDTSLGPLRSDSPLAWPPGTSVHVLVRPDDVLHDDASDTAARIVDRAFRGSHFLYTLELADRSRLLCLAPSHHDHPPGETLGIRLEIDHMVVFPAD
ncbi:MAG: ABC transporter ATP-binding protein [Pseudomonadota bacterium]